MVQLFKLNGAVYDGGSVSIMIIPGNKAALSPLGTVAALADKVGLGKVVQALGMKDVQGVEAISYGFNMTKSMYKGAGNVQRGWTPGHLSYTNGSITLWQSELNDWIDKMGGTQGFAFSDFNIVISYRVQANMPLTKVELKGCSPASIKSNISMSSTENLTVTLEFFVSDVIYNGNKAVNMINKTVNAVGNIL